MKSFKYTIIVVAIIELAMIAFVVLEKPTESVRPDRITVTFWHAMGGPLGRVLNSMVERFNQEQDKIFVNAQYMGSYDSLRQKLIASLISNTTPDCAQAYEAWISKLIRGKAIIPLDKFFAREGKEFKEDIIPVMLEDITFDGKIWSMPFNKSLPVLYYNRDLFREVGLDPDRPPETWEEYVEVCKKLTRDIDSDGVNDTWGTAFSPNATIFGCLLCQAGGRFLNKDRSKVLLNTPEAVAALQHMMDLIITHKVAYRTVGYDNQNDFIARKVGIVEGSVVSKVYMERSIDFDWGMAPLPGKKIKAAILAGTNVVIFPRSDPKKEEAAWEFIKWFTNTENTSFWSINTGYMPVRKSAINSPQMQDYFKKEPRVRAAIDQLDYAVFEPRISAWFKCRDILGKTLEEAIIKHEAPKKFLDPMVERMNLILYYER